MTFKTCFDITSAAHVAQTCATVFQQFLVFLCPLKLKKQGAEGFVHLRQVMQMDILPTREGTPVIFHDTSLKRATGIDKDIRQARECTSTLVHTQPVMCLHKSELL